MAEFQELIKNFNHLRTYIRTFYIYGYATRNTINKKSKRTYDNEKRRIASYLGEYMKYHYSKKGKAVFLSIDSAGIFQNPFYKAYQSKSFTDNDIMLHFFILDRLECKKTLTAGQMADEISLAYGEVFDVQTVRGKLREYEKEGILQSQKVGKALYYKKSEDTVERFFPNKESMEDCLIFASENMPFSVVGSYICNRMNLKNKRFLWKHHFIAYTLDDIILLQMVKAIEENRQVELINISRKTNKEIIIKAIPFFIFVSTQTGRRYVFVYTEKEKRFLTLRLDYIEKITVLDMAKTKDMLQQKAKKALQTRWGTSVAWQSATEHFEMTLFVDEQKEQFIIDRLKREKRFGTVKKVEKNTYCFSIDVTDTNEMMNWVKTFTGRIIHITGDNQAVIRRFYKDMYRMAQLYKD